MTPWIKGMERELAALAGWPDERRERMGCVLEMVWKVGAVEVVAVLDGARKTLKLRTVRNGWAVEIEAARPMELRKVMEDAGR